ncbi:uncharacterized protein CTRU02_212086 [Colletotrichum truncatum]|uniref:Uncharacterized protein n=1 Tax=Colletotrichum truncatum TaxID=5467 RepID=A0ACC3YMI5_COLTU|nr:uncharacterized protein CTRU02_06843 [Colletotrichum truncatum]KAF6792226.1 hypothetical protein CTRU02_06843 [Colletotrichum truncatum]
MKTTQTLFAAAALLASTNAQQVPAVTPAPARYFFIYDSHPAGSLEASVVGYSSSSITRVETTYRVACPSANEACKKEGYYPVDITHSDGSHWAGTNTATAGLVKRWECNLGNFGNATLSDQYGWCTETTVSGSSTAVAEQQAVNTCFVEARSIVVAMTAGLEKFGSRTWWGTRDASYYLSFDSEKWNTETCKPFSSATPTGSPAKTTESGSPTRSSTDSASLPTEAGTASVTVAETGVVSGNVAPSGSAPPSGSGRMLTSMPLALGATVVGVMALI